MEWETCIRVLIVDDNASVREGLTAMIGRQQDINVVAEARNGQEGVAMFRQHQPDVTLMDLRMPLMDGIEATQTIRDEFPHACILVVTTFREEEPISRALSAGAQGYVLKDITREQLLEAIHAAVVDCSSH